ncbi:YL1 nuclear protein-domain-containing protein [Xylaria palmicola]|nr:YL1 nuclear protein-domain-containing protein [Xylaria palmicola]
MPSRDDDDGERMQVDDEENDPLSSESSDSENGLSGDEEPSSKVEWLATGREKRSTAGNRMKSMLAAEEPDDELELLFAEDGEDEGFTEVEDDGSDAQMSSSEDEDGQGNADELEGEKELEKQAHESRQAARKRKAQEAIPVKFRKKVRIDTSQTPSASATPAPKPRPRKKSERISWLPSPADMPTRASKRETTMAGKEQLHKQMAEREVKRLKQIEAMERKARRLEALKKPPMTQAERLAEAALVEKRNAKSLNRWEVAEKQREEERKAKLAALNNRTLEGPVVTFWSGVGEWIDGKLKHVGKIVTIEEKPAKKKRHSAVGTQATAESTGETHEDKAVVTNSDPPPGKTAAVGTDAPLPQNANAKPEQGKEPVVSNVVGPADTGGVSAASSASVGAVAEPPHNNNTGVMTLAAPPISSTVSTTQEAEVSKDLSPRDQGSTHLENVSTPNIPPQTNIRPPDLRAPDLQPPSTSLYTTSMFAPPTQSSLMMPELKPPSNSFLAPPVGVSQNGLSMPMIGYHPLSSTSSSNVLAAPNPAQRQSPLSMPQTNIHPPPPAPTPTRPPQVISTPKPSAPLAPMSALALPSPRPHSKISLAAPKSTKANSHKHQPKELAPPPPPSPPANGKATRNCIILQNFNENAIKDKTVQTRILFAREMNKLPKQGPAVRCVITNHPARHRDPKTGLPYYNSYAFKQIRKLYSGEYKWSSLVGAWIGSETSAATGVPARFLDPDAPGPPKEQHTPDVPTEPVRTNEDSNKDGESWEADTKPPQISAPSAGQPSHTSAPGTASKVGNNTQSTTDRPSVGPTITEASSTIKGPSGNNEPDVPTTGATFELKTEVVTAPLDTPITYNTHSYNTNSSVVNNMSDPRPTEAVNISTGPPGPPPATTDVPLTTSSLPAPESAPAAAAPPIVVEKGSANQ